MHRKVLSASHFNLTVNPLPAETGCSPNAEQEGGRRRPVKRSLLASFNATESASPETSPISFATTKSERSTTGSMPGAEFTTLSDITAKLRTMEKDAGLEKSAPPEPSFPLRGNGYQVILHPELGETVKEEVFLSTQKEGSVTQLSSALDPARHLHKQSMSYMGIGSFRNLHLILLYSDVITDVTIADININQLRLWGLFFEHLSGYSFKTDATAADIYAFFKTFAELRDVNHLMSGSRYINEAKWNGIDTDTVISPFCKEISELFECYYDKAPQEASSMLAKSLCRIQSVIRTKPVNLVQFDAKSPDWLMFFPQKSFNFVYVSNLPYFFSQDTDFLGHTNRKETVATFWENLHKVGTRHSVLYTDYVMRGKFPRKTPVPLLLTECHEPWLPPALCGLIKQSVSTMVFNVTDLKRYLSKGGKQSGLVPVSDCYNVLLKLFDIAFPPSATRQETELRILKQFLKTMCEYELDTLKNELENRVKGDLDDGEKEALRRECDRLRRYTPDFKNKTIITTPHVDPVYAIVNFWLST